MVTTAGLLEAYYDCRRNKRKTASALVYEMDYESKLIALRDRINTRTYAPGKSICFVVTRPRYREVFAAFFEDRIVHHYIALRLEPLFEQAFCPYTYNCRKGKGQLYGTNVLRQQIIECSDNYTTDCYIMKLDLRQAEHAVNSINSYLGLLRHNNEYNTRKRVLKMIESQAYEYVYIKKNYSILALKNKYKKRVQTYKRIRDGDY